MATFPDKSSLKDEFAELHCRSNFSFLAGASHPEEIVSQAHALGYQAIAITDECSVAGIVKAHVAAKTKGIHLIVGATFRIETDLGIPIDIVLLAPNRLAYGQLCTLSPKREDENPRESTRCPSTIYAGIQTSASPFGYRPTYPSRHSWLLLT